MREQLPRGIVAMAACAFLVASLPCTSLAKETGREIIGKDGAPMVLVPAGKFLYGDNKERRSLPAFYMDKFEVTTKRYAAFLQSAGRIQPTDWPKQVAAADSGDRPVVQVTWLDADAYCRQYGRRLPTEEEWEKAARGTDGRTFPWGNGEPTNRHANYGKDLKFSDPYSERLTAVGHHDAGKSPYGLYDMAGNVWEWTSSDDVKERKVVKGGSWFSRSSDVRSAFREGIHPAKRDDSGGFRCAQDAPKP
jgi:formylglycine-generating enzyme required for sulfatase activity